MKRRYLAPKTHIVKMLAKTLKIPYVDLGKFKARVSLDLEGLPMNHYGKSGIGTVLERRVP